MKLKYIKTKATWSNYSYGSIKYPRFNDKVKFGYTVQELNQLKVEHKKKLLWIKVIQPPTFDQEILYKLVE